MDAMPEMIERRRYPVGDNFPADPAYFCPPEPRERGGEITADGEPTGERIGALVSWLGHITPPGAPLVPILNVPHAPGPGCVPLIARSLSLAGRPPAWPPRKRDAAIGAAVPVGLQRPRRAEGRRKRGARPRWQMEAAYFRDLCGDDEDRLAGRLDLSADHGADEHKRGPRARSVRRYIAAGRKQLSALGAWPWCMDEDGRLESRWWTRRRYAEALAEWHFMAFADALDEALRPVRHAAGERPTWRVVDYQLAARLYREQFPRLARVA